LEALAWIDGRSISLGKRIYLWRFSSILKRLPSAK
jgi:hypothetical protein